MNILFVCTGNTCRSPMAEGYLSSLNISGVSVRSRGLYADRSPVSENSAQCMQDIGIDITKHISKQITPEDINWADKIICMSASHEKALRDAAKDKVWVLGDGISDPFGGDIELYRLCREEIIKQIDLMFSGFAVVPLEYRHIEQIAHLEKICFSQPWTADGITESFKAGTRFFVAERDGKVLGYAGLSAVLDEGYITNVAVFPEYRKKGIATAVLKAVFRFAKQNSLSFVSLEVRPSNTDAVSLYEKFGFMAEGRRKNFYKDPQEDALIMTKRFD